MKPTEPTEKAADLTRTLRIDVRVSSDEKRDLQARAKAAGYRKVSTYLRDAGSGIQVRESIPAELRRQLVSIGTDLNQLARLAQAGQLLGSHEEQLRQVLATIRGYLS